MTSLSRCCSKYCLINVYMILTVGVYYRVVTIQRLYPLGSIYSDTVLLFINISVSNFNQTW